MGCGNSKQVPNTVVSDKEMKKNDKADALAPQKSADTAKASNNSGPNGSAVAFEIPIDELKVPANMPSSAQLKDDDGKDTEQLKAELKAKEEHAEKNRQKELEKIQQKAQEREEQAKKVLERKKENGSKEELGDVEAESHDHVKQEAHHKHPNNNSSLSVNKSRNIGSKSNLPLPKSNGSKANLKK